MSGGATEYKSQNKEIKWTDKDIARVKKVRSKAAQTAAAFRRRYHTHHACSRSIHRLQNGPRAERLPVASAWQQMKRLGSH